MDKKEIIRLTSYYGFYLGLAVTIYAIMAEAAYVITGTEKLSATTFLFPLFLLAATFIIKKAGTLKE